MKPRDGQTLLQMLSVVPAVEVRFVRRIDVGPDGQLAAGRARSEGHERGLPSLNAAVCGNAWSSSNKKFALAAIAFAYDQDGAPGVTLAELFAPMRASTAQ